MKTLLCLALLFALAFPASARQIQTLRGEAFFLERIALPPNATLHVSLVGRVAGAEYLPLATTVIPAQNGATPFQLVLPAVQLPPAPYRLQAWIVADNRLFMHGHAPQTMVKNLDAPVKFRLKIVPAPQNIDGIGDGKPLPTKIMLQGTVSKLDRRALLPAARLEIRITDLMTPSPDASIVFRHTVELKGAQLPQSFQISLAPGLIVAKRVYGLEAMIVEDGKMTFLTKAFVRVTPENLGEKFELKLVPGL